MTERLSAIETGPYLQAALFCEQVLDEKDNIKSLIRLFDRYIVQRIGADAPETMPEIELDFSLFVAFKSGEAVGPVPIKLTLTKPSGLTDPNPLWSGSIHFEGGVRGHNLIVRMRTRFKEAGPYWVSVYVGDRLATKIPLEIIYTFARAGGQSQP